MMKVPKLPSAEDKLAALKAASGQTETTLANKETNGKPWLLADKKTKVAYPARLDGDINAKLEFMLQHLGRGVSKNAVINQAIGDHVDRWLAENGYN